MTNSQKILIKKLLTGHFLRKQKRGKAIKYILYDAAINPQQVVRLKTIDNIDRFIDPSIELWKKSKNGDISFNLSMVRRLHGNHIIKRMYKQRHELNADGAIYKKRTITKKAKTQNEKVYLLF